MEKCPKCGQWTLALNTQQGVMACRRVECQFEQKIDVNQYLIADNILPKLSMSLRLIETSNVSTCLR
jgi:hypothetical protein